MFTDSARTSQETLRLHCIEQLASVFRKLIAVFAENYNKMQGVYNVNVYATFSHSVPQPWKCELEVVRCQNRQFGSSLKLYSHYKIMSKIRSAEFRTLGEVPSQSSFTLYFKYEAYANNMLCCHMLEIIGDCSRVSGCIDRGPGFDSLRYQIFRVAVGL
jgi:hypothetical protein